MRFGGRVCLLIGDLSRKGFWISSTSKGTNIATYCKIEICKYCNKRGHLEYNCRFKDGAATHKDGQNWKKETEDE